MTSRRPFLSAVIFFGIGIVCFISNSALFLKLYPVLISGMLLGVFGSTLFFPPVMIFRFAILQDKSIKGSLAEKRIEAYCRRVTLVWCVFFVLNGGIAAGTVFFASDAVWTVYNGGISYILMGALFLGELIIRKMIDKNMPKAAPLSGFTKSSRSPGSILCYADTYRRGEYKTWKDFLTDTALLRREILGRGEGAGSLQWLLHCGDYWYFLVAFTALLQCKKQVLLTPSVSPDYIQDISTGDTAFLTDQAFSPEQFPGETLYIPSILSSSIPGMDTEDPPAINADETVIIMYTSGTTGQPKAVRQRLTEFEIDNRFILSKWGEEFLTRKLCSTVSPHHIYGLLFSVLLPFTAGTPFRRSRIEYPGEFEKFTDDSYLIITVPAFLKRSVEIENPASLGLRSPWIFSSGGELPRETAEKTDKIFGFWPLEVYGSTETSGIAYRQSKNGPAWTPFDNAEIRKNDEGCLVIRSPYIMDPAGFTTGDLADILEDGRFILKGRADSIVKIEEKRISLPEVENRLIRSGLVSDLCVVALTDRRQYLAAALVLNKAGKEKFRHTPKYLINRFFQEYLLGFFENVVVPKKWRYLDTLPTDAQGKKKKLEIRALFESSASRGAINVFKESPGPALPADAAAPFSPPPDPGADSPEPSFHGVSCQGVLENTGLQAVLELFIPAESEYFDGHFPEFKLLPAVAQVDLVTWFASRCLGTSRYVSKIRRIKFSQVISPGTRVRLEISYNKEQCFLAFKILSPDRGISYSAGTLILGSSL